MFFTTYFLTKRAVYLEETQCPRIRFTGQHHLPFIMSYSTTRNLQSDDGDAESVNGAALSEFLWYSVNIGGKFHMAYSNVTHLVFDASVTSPPPSAISTCSSWSTESFRTAYTTPSSKSSHSSRPQPMFASFRTVPELDFHRAAREEGT